MDLEQLQTELERLIKEVTSDNFQAYYGRFEQAILAYRNTGAPGRPVYEHLLKLDRKYSDVNQWKDEILLDIMNRISGFAPPFRKIIFDDFDEQRGTWRL